MTPAATIQAAMTHQRARTTRLPKAANKAERYSPGRPRHELMTVAKNPPDILPPGDVSRPAGGPWRGKRAEGCAARPQRVRRRPVYPGDAHLYVDRLGGAALAAR